MAIGKHDLGHTKDFTDKLRGERCRIDNKLRFGSCFRISRRFLLLRPDGERMRLDNSRSSSSSSSSSGSRCRRRIVGPFLCFNFRTRKTESELGKGFQQAFQDGVKSTKDFEPVKGITLRRKELGDEK
jgi:hypothetical protein